MREKLAIENCFIQQKARKIHCCDGKGTACCSFAVLFKLNLLFNFCHIVVLVTELINQLGNIASESFNYKWSLPRKLKQFSNTNLQLCNHNKQVVHGGCKLLQVICCLQKNIWFGCTFCRLIHPGLPQEHPALDGHCSYYVAYYCERVIFYRAVHSHSAGVWNKL